MEDEATTEETAETNVEPSMSNTSKDEAVENEDDVLSTGFTSPQPDESGNIAEELEDKDSIVSKSIMSVKSQRKESQRSSSPVKSQTLTKSVASLLSKISPRSTSSAKDKKSTKGSKLSSPEHEIPMTNSQFKIFYDCVKKAKPYKSPPSISSASTSSEEVAELIFNGSGQDIFDECSPVRMLNANNGYNQGKLLPYLKNYGDVEDLVPGKLEKQITQLTAEKCLLKKKLEDAVHQIHVLTGKLTPSINDQSTIDAGFLKNQKKVLELKREVRQLQLNHRCLNEACLQHELEKEKLKRENRALRQDNLMQCRMAKELKSRLHLTEKQLETTNILVQHVNTKMATMVHWLHPEPRPSLDFLNKENSKVLQCMLEKLVMNVDDQLTCLRATVDKVKLDNKQLKRALCCAEDAARANADKVEQMQEKFFSIQESMEPYTTELSMICNPGQKNVPICTLNEEDCVNACADEVEEEIQKLKTQVQCLKGERDNCYRKSMQKQDKFDDCMDKIREKYKCKIKKLVEKLKLACQQSEQLRRMIQNKNLCDDEDDDDYVNCTKQYFMSCPTVTEQNNNNYNPARICKSEIKQKILDKLAETEQRLKSLNTATLCSPLPCIPLSPPSKYINKYARNTKNCIYPGTINNSYQEPCSRNGNTLRFGNNTPTWRDLCTDQLYQSPKTPPDDQLWTENIGPRRRHQFDEAKVKEQISRAKDWAQAHLQLPTAFSQGEIYPSPPPVVNSQPPMNSNENSNNIRPINNNNTEFGYNYQPQNNQQYPSTQQNDTFGHQNPETRGYYTNCCCHCYSNPCCCSEYTG